MSAETLSLEYIAANYGTRNLSMALTPRVDLSKPMSVLLIIGPSPSVFSATVTVRVPPQTLLYVPPVSKMLKDAWIQYMAFFLVVWFLLFRLNSFVFSHRLLHSMTVTDVVTATDRKRD